MTSISTNEYIDKSEDIVNIQNNSFHRAIKMKSADVKSSTHIDLDIENFKNPKFKACNCVRISKYKTFLQKSKANLSEEGFVVEIE